MGSARYQIKIGAITCTVISDGSGTMEAEGRFPQLSKEEIAAAMAAINQTTLENHFNCMLIQTGDLNILADAGLGAGARPGGLGQVGVELGKMGITPDQIDTVYITHFHGDHINGLFDSDGGLVFTNANYITVKTEWDYWNSAEGLEKMGDRAAGFKTMLDSLKPHLKTINVGDTITDGVKTFAAFGHTPGHTGLIIESEGEKLVDMVDTVHALIQMQHPEWSPRFDTDPDLAAKTRQEVFSWLADENLLTVAYHFPFPGTGHVQRNGDGFIWEPI